MKHCEICGDEYQESRKTQKYCKVCGKNPEQTRRKYAKAEITNKIHAGDLYKPREITCLNCGKKILTTYGLRFCSKLCEEEHRMKTARCLYCNGLLIEKGNLTGRGYCSEECRQEARLKKAKENGNYVPCEYCGKMFIRSGYANRFCCKDCYRKQIEKQMAEKGKPVSLNNMNRTEQRKCEHCGNPFTWSFAHSAKRFCSTECRINKKKADKKKSIETLNLGKELHICTVCKTSMIECERFTSNLTKPPGAKGKRINGKYVIYYCPKFKE